MAVSEKSFGCYKSWHYKRRISQTILLDFYEDKHELLMPFFLAEDLLFKTTALQKLFPFGILLIEIHSLISRSSISTSSTKCWIVTKSTYWPPNTYKWPRNAVDCKPRSSKKFDLVWTVLTFPTIQVGLRSPAAIKVDLCWSLSKVQRNVRKITIKCISNLFAW